ncbi:MAG: TonB-dependent receptor, partial [Chromatiales bacterium]
MIRIIPLIPYFLFLAVVPSASAQTTDVSARDLDTLVVTGTRLRDDLSRVPNSTTVIDLETIEARRDASVVDLLRAVPGVQITQYGGRGGLTSLFVRGSEPNFTVVMIDGIKVNDPNNTRGGSFDFSTLHVNDIERIEIVRGPQSSIYGSDALAGVINIITKRGTRDFEVTVDAEAGRDEYYRGGVGMSGPVGESGDFSLRAGYVDDGDPVEGNDFTSTAVTGKLFVNPLEDMTVRLSGRYTDSDDFAIGADMTWELSERFTLHALGSYYDHQENTDSPGIAPGVRDPVPPNGADTELERYEAASYLVWSMGSGFSSTVGADYWNEEGDSKGFVDFGFPIPTDFNLDRDIVGLFGELKYETAAITLQTSVRRDDPDDEDDETSTKFGAVYRFQNGFSRVFANWGEGFKLPSFFALGHPLVGNPELKPEKSEGWDIGWGQELIEGQLSFTVSYYDNEFKDLIDFDFELFTNVNRSRVDTSGYELEFDYRPLDVLSFRAHATYLDIDAKEPGVQLRQRPDWRGGVSATWLPHRDWLVN